MFAGTTMFEDDAAKQFGTGQVGEKELGGIYEISSFYFSRIVLHNRMCLESFSAE